MGQSFDIIEVAIQFFEKKRRRNIFSGLKETKSPSEEFSHAMDFPCGSAGKEFARSVGDLVSIPGLGRSPGQKKGYPFQ